jgi:hypothetical protein
MTSPKWRKAYGISTTIAAVVTVSTLATGTASANSDARPTAGITVPAEPTAAPDMLVASLEGRNEVTAGALVGQALALIGLQGNTVTYTLAWRGISTPTGADIHTGVRGMDGPTVVPLFSTPSPTGDLATGTITLTDPTLVAALRSDPQSFYVELRTNRFPGGALRAQLHALHHQVSTSGVAALQESVVHGSQIYACAPQSDGTLAFIQHDVDAHLTGGIHHTFVQPNVGPPQWQAPDGSAVSGTVVTKNTNGNGNIAELDLDATQIGEPSGLLAHAVEVLRLNTVGGVAPAGTCDPQATPTVNIPYQADYVFVNG